MNLIICCTPLQVLIAEKIMEAEPNRTFFSVMLMAVKNEKYEFYAKRLAEKCEEFIGIYQKTDRIGLFKELFSVKKQFSQKEFDQVFVANLNELTIQVLLSSITFNQLNTFDDGTANIISNSFLYVKSPETLMRKVVNFVFANKYNTQKLRALSQCHYTLFAGMPNIIDKVKPIQLLPEITENQQEQEPVNLFLGQPVFADNQKNVYLAQKVIKQFNIHYYFPHPRETYTLDDVEIIRSKLIFEDYLVQHFSNRPCNIYTYFSGAILNVMKISPQVQVNALKIEVTQPEYIACYDLFESLGINIIDIRE